MSYVEIGVTELGRSEEFYAGLLGLATGTLSEDDHGRRVRWLGSGDAPHAGRVKLVELGADARPTSWERDDLQRGIRHFGLKVRDIDAAVATLAAAGVELAVKPFDAFGGVRIAFFFDPDGAYLEFVQGHVQHNNVWSEGLVAEEAAAYQDWDGTPRFDHVAVTVPDLDGALDVYRDQLGFGVVGQLVRPEDERGFLITNLRAGAGTLEVFTYGVATHRREGDALVERTGADNRLGIRRVGVAAAAGVEAGSLVGPGDVLIERVA
ncbi:VOC family protein [Actinopolymorpha sp. B9G3]|uniref:VOC family protein n=1 Tax=Actinopolymorpha sp. B9G3 TaxID=3158970 RepID=UPI0032D93639